MNPYKEGYQIHKYKKQFSSFLKTKLAFPISNMHSVITRQRSDGLDIGGKSSIFDVMIKNIFSFVHFDVKIVKRILRRHKTTQTHTAIIFSTKNTAFLNLSPRICILNCTEYSMQSSFLNKIEIPSILFEIGRK